MSLLDQITKNSMYGMYGTTSTGEKITSLPTSYENSTFDDTVQRAARDFESRCPYGPNPFGVYSQDGTSVGVRIKEKIASEVNIGNVTYGDVDTDVDGIVNYEKKEIKMGAMDKLFHKYFSDNIEKEEAKLATEERVKYMTEQLDKIENTRDKDDRRPSISLSEICYVCYKIGDMKRCSRCKITYYCSLECQKKNWQKHKHTCVAPN